MPPEVSTVLEGFESNTPQIQTMGRCEVPDHRPVTSRDRRLDVVDGEPSPTDVDDEPDQGTNHLMTESGGGHLETKQRWASVKTRVVAPTGRQEGPDQGCVGFGPWTSTERREVVGTHYQLGRRVHRPTVEILVDPP